MTEPGGVLLDRVQLEGAFTALGERLVRRGVVADVFVVGGAAMALAYDATRVTRDVDSLKRDVRDRFGLRVPNLHFNDHQNYLAMRAHPYAAMRRARSGSAPYPAGHNLDAARMRARPEDRHRKRVRPRAGWAEPIRVRWQRDEHRGGSERGADGSRARPTSPRRC